MHVVSPCLDSWGVPPTCTLQCLKEHLGCLRLRSVQTLLPFRIMGLRSLKINRGFIQDTALGRRRRTTNVLARRNGELFEPEKSRLRWRGSRLTPRRTSRFSSAVVADDGSKSATVDTWPERRPWPGRLDCFSSNDEAVIRSTEQRWQSTGHVG